MKTLTEIGLNKNLIRLRDSLDYATYEENGVKKRVSIFRADVQGNKIKIYVYLDDTVTGAVSNVSLVDKDGDVIAIAKRAFTKLATKGIYAVFSYTFVEVEDPDAPILSGGDS